MPTCGLHVKDYVLNFSDFKMLCNYVPSILKISYSCLMISYTYVCSAQNCPGTCMKTKGYCLGLYEIKVQVYEIIKIDGTHESRQNYSKR